MVVVSFNDDVIAAFHEFAPDVVTSPALDALTAWFGSGGELLPSHRVFQIPPSNDDLDVLRLPGFFEKAAEENRAMWVWPNDADTQENPDFYEELLDSTSVASLPVTRIRPSSATANSALSRLSPHRCPRSRAPARRR